MPQDYTVEQGDCINSIAFDNGFAPKTLWNHPSNSDLKSQRKDPNVLMEGDVVHIPDITQKQESRPTDKRHKFVLNGVPAKLQLRFKFDNKPRANIPYILNIDGKVTQGNTDGDGWVKTSIAPNAAQGTITLNPPNANPEVYPLQLGQLDPLDTVKGQQARLINLGFLSGDASGDKTPEFVSAVHAFQKAFGLQQTGAVDQDTQQKLKDAHLS